MNTLQKNQQASHFLQQPEWAVSDPTMLFPGNADWTDIQDLKFDGSWTTSHRKSETVDTSVSSLSGGSCDSLAAGVWNEPSVYQNYSSSCSSSPNYHHQQDITDPTAGATMMMMMADMTGHDTTTHYPHDASTVGVASVGYADLSASVPPWLQPQMMDRMISARSGDIAPGDAEEEEDVHRCRWRNCRVQTSNLDDLIVHIRDEHVGSGRSAYYCHWAGCPRSRKPFTKRHKMHNHMRTHTGERPFACTVQGCSKRFSRPDSLSTHIKTHSNIRPYHCKEPNCGKAYFHSRSLRKHTRSHEEAAAAAAQGGAHSSKVSPKVKQQQQERREWAMMVRSAAARRHQHMMQRRRQADPYNGFYPMIDPSSTFSSGAPMLHSQHHQQRQHQQTMMMPPATATEYWAQQMPLYVPSS